MAYDHSGYSEGGILMAKTDKFKKAGDFKLRLVGLALCGLMLGGIVMAGCGSSDNGDDTGTANTANTTNAPDATDE
jgi:hypothetical protein